MLGGVWMVVDPITVCDLGLICRGRNRALAASADRRMIGN